MGTFNAEQFYGRLSANIINFAGMAFLSFALIIAALVYAPVDAQVTTRSKDGQITANGQSITVDTFGRAGVGLQLAGTWTGTVTFQGTVNGGTFVTIMCTNITSGVATEISSTANGAWRCASGGLSKVRATSTAAWTGTASVSLLASAN
jgi:hypothetical protein